uniref:Uncharacterized protein n=1 Tax=Setaria italica TaxID=4555 RepID=K3Y3Z6_SETIT
MAGRIPRRAGRLNLASAGAGRSQPRRSSSHPPEP